MAVTLLVVAALPMVCLPFAVAFHAVRGMYLHAERLPAKAGGSKCKERGNTRPERSGGRRAAQVTLKQQREGKEWERLVAPLSLPPSPYCSLIALAK